jgi:hypothetical protein
VAHSLEIGRSLREAREARGLALEAVEKDTKIRARYLHALEEERFGELPGEAYARGFLRTYADHLGLDGPEVLAAYRARQRVHEEAAVAPRPQRPYTPLRIGPALAGLAAAVILAGLSLVAWQLGEDDPETVVRTRPQPAAPATAAAPAVLVLRVTAPSTLEVRLAGRTGRRLWAGTLRPGQRLRLGLGRPLWLRAGAAHRLRLVVAGKARRLPRGATAALVTRSGVRRL